MAFCLPSGGQFVGLKILQWLVLAFGWCTVRPSNAGPTFAHLARRTASVCNWLRHFIILVADFETLCLLQGCR